MFGLNLSVEEARAARICRVCARPINHPPTDAHIEECLEHRGDSAVVQKDGREFAHAVCLGGSYAFGA